MSPELYSVGVPVLGALLVLLGVGLAIRGGTNTAPHQAKLGPLGVTSPGPGITIALIGTLLVLAPRIWPDVGQAAPAEDDKPPSTSPGTSPPDDDDPTRPEPDPPIPGPPHTDDDTEHPTDVPASTHSITTELGTIDLDRARLIDGPDLDANGELFFFPPGELTAQNFYRLAVADASTLSGCVDALDTYNDPGISSAELRSGVEFCMETSEGAVAGVVVESWDPQSHKLALAWTLWQP